jgi:hypothetical protein
MFKPLKNYFVTQPKCPTMVLNLFYKRVLYIVIAFCSKSFGTGHEGPEGE